MEEKEQYRMLEEKEELQVGDECSPLWCSDPNKADGGWVALTMVVPGERFSRNAYVPVRRRIVPEKESLRKQ